jgi:gas vesicle protein
VSNEEGTPPGGFWLGLMVGSLLGAVTAYLTVTDEKDKRKLIARGKELLGKLEDFGQEIGEKGEELGKDVIETVSGVSEKVEELPQLAKPVVRAVKRRRFFLKRSK